MLQHLHRAEEHLVRESNRSRDAHSKIIDTHLHTNHTDSHQFFAFAAGPSSSSS